MIRKTLVARLLGTLLLSTLLLSLGARADMQPLDRIVAVVNDGVIMQSELDARVDDIAAQFRADNRPMPPLNVMQEQVLDRMILERVQLQMAERAGIRVDDAALNQALEGIARQNNMTLPQFSETLRGDGYDWSQFREQIRNEMVISRLQQRSVASRIRITDREVERFLQSETGKRMFQADFHLGHILVKVPAAPARIRCARPSRRPTIWSTGCAAAPISRKPRWPNPTAPGPGRRRPGLARSGPVAEPVRRRRHRHAKRRHQRAAALRGRLPHSQDDRPARRRRQGGHPVPGTPRADPRRHPHHRGRGPPGNQPPARPGGQRRAELRRGRRARLRRPGQRPRRRRAGLGDPG